MMRSLYSGVSGLRNHQTRMDVVGNNIANVNTVGFKASRTIFQDMYSQTLAGASAPGTTTGGTNPNQVGLGMTLATIDTLFTSSAAQVTGRTFDLMIENDGFFVVRNGLGQDEYFTRAGNFYLDKQNNLVTASGMYLMGFQALISPGTAAVDAVASVYDTSRSSIPNIKRAVVADITTNGLSAMQMTATVADAAGVLTVTVGGETFTNVTALPSNPTANQTITLTSTTSPGKTIDIEITPAYAQGDLNNTKFIVNASGAAVDTSDIFKIKNNLVPATSPIDGSVDIQLPGAKNNAKYTIKDDPSLNVIYITQTLGDGSQGQVVEVARPMPGESVIIAGFGMQFKAATAYQAGDLDGVVFQMDKTGRDAEPQGSPISTFANTSDNLNKIYIDPLLTSVTIDKNGKVFGVASKDGVITCPSSGAKISVKADQRVEIGQVAVAVFDNQEALEKMGENLYKETANTGDAKYNKPGENGSGQLKAGALEMSNVDLAQEFTDMIVTQRGFQANSRIITTSDSMLEELVNLKR